jgi:hypothetical protein
MRTIPCLLLILACLALPAAPARAMDLTGTWTITNRNGGARCRAVNFGGGSFSTLAFLGPLQISHQADRPIYIHLHAGPGDDVGYQGVEAPEPPVGPRGTAFATSCHPFVLFDTNYRGQFVLNADDVHGTMHGKFVGNDPGGRPISCTFAAKRTSTADPGVAACP